MSITGRSWGEANVAEHDEANNAKRVVSLGSGTYPASNVLFDDNFTTGFCGWEKLWNAAGTGAFNVGMSTPLSLSCHGTFGQYSLLLQTNNQNADTYGSQCFAIKRWTMQHQDQPTRIVDAEWWFSYGSNNPDDAAVSGNGGAPRNILFAIDTQTPNDDLEAVSTGERCYFIAMWRQIVGGGSFVRDPQWYLNAASPFPYGNPSYNSPDNGNYTATGYRSDLPYNGNKRNVNYVRLTCDVVNQTYLELQANDKIFDLTSLPAQNNGPVTSPISLDDPDYNDTGFNGGLNMLLAVNNRTDTDTTASYVELHRAKMSWR